MPSCPGLFPICRRVGQTSRRLSADPEGKGMLWLNPPCVAMGHSAGGVTATMVLSSGLPQCGVDIGALQRAMTQHGMELGLQLVGQVP